MRLQRVSLILGCLLGLLLFTDNVNETQALYPYAIKGFVADVRHTPGLLVGGWALKKAIKLIKLKFLLKLKIKLKLKFIAKKILLKFLLGRKKRAIDNDGIDLPENMIPEIHDSDIMPYFTLASEFDTDGCLPKGVCEVMARGNRSQMNMFETMVYDDYGKNMQRPENTSSPSFVYEYAAYYGRTTGDEKACAGLFSNCKETPQKLNKFMDETFVSDICDGPDEVQFQQHEETSKPTQWIY